MYGAHKERGARSTRNEHVHSPFDDRIHRSINVVTGVLIFLPGIFVSIHRSSVPRVMPGALHLRQLPGASLALEKGKNIKDTPHDGSQTCLHANKMAKRMDRCYDNGYGDVRTWSSIK